MVRLCSVDSVFRLDAVFNLKIAKTKSPVDLARPRQSAGLAMQSTDWYATFKYWQRPGRPGIRKDKCSPKI